MKFTTAKEHRDFFQKHHMLEVEGLIPIDQLHLLQKDIHADLAKRLKESDPEKIFAIGRDLWRSSNTVKKTVLSKTLAEIAAEIFEKKPLRIGYDQLFPYPLGIEYRETDGPYYALLKTVSSLEEIGSMQGIVCGLMLCLQGDSEDNKISIFPKKAGNGVYFSPKVLMNLEELQKRPNQLFLLIVYTQSTAVYIRKERDPNGNFLRDKGYSFGDKLKDSTNPIVYR